MTTIVRRARRFAGEVPLPGDKSLSHRALIFGALSEAPLAIENLAAGEDVQATARCLRALGAKIETSGGLVRVRGPARLRAPDAVLDCGNSGTTMRLLAGVIAGAGIAATLDGDESLRRRPMGRVIAPLRQMGARCEGRQAGDEIYAPLVFRPGPPLRGGRYEIPVASAQVKSAILLAGRLAGVEVEVREPRLSRDHTERMLAAFEKSPPARLRIPADPSSAAFLAAAAALIPGAALRLPGVNTNPTRTGWLHALRAMGAAIEARAPGEAAGEPTATLHARHAPRLRGVRIGPAQVPALIDELPILAVVATQAEGVTEIRGAAELRVKESDRIAAMTEGLSRMGARVEALGDGLRIHGPTPLRGARVRAASDHRVAMSLAVAGLVAEGETAIEGGAWAAVSFPAFFRTLADLQR